MVCLLKKIALMGIISICMLILSGCGQMKEELQESVKSEEEQITLTIGLNESANNAGAIMSALAKDFEEETGVRIEFQEYPDAQWRDGLKTKLSDGTAPDIFVVDSDPFSLYDRIHPDLNCIDLTNEEFVSRMDENVLSAISYDGKVYGITFSGQKIWLYTYRKDVFEELGISIPTSYEELKNTCERLKLNGITPMWQATSSGWHQVLPIFECGPMYLQDNPDLYTKLNENSYDLRNVSGLLTILTQMNEFAELGYYGTDFLENNMDNEMEAFANGEFAMTLEGVAWSTEVIKKYPEMENKLGIFIMPWGDNQLIGINPASNAMYGNANSPYQEEILSYFRFLARHDNLQKRLDGDDTILATCWPEIESKYPDWISDYLKEYKEELVMQAAVSYIDAQWMDVGQDIEKMFVGLMTPEDVLEEIYNRRNKLAELADDPYWK